MRLQIIANVLPLEKDTYQKGEYSMPLAPFQWLDLSSSTGVRMTTGPHGFEALSGFYPDPSKKAEAFFLAMGTPTVYLKAGSYTAWKGRLEDITHTKDGLRWTAYGPFRYFSDKLISRMYSTQDISKIRPITEDDASGYAPSMWRMDKNERLFIAPEKNGTYGNGIDRGGMVFFAPHLRDDVKRIEFDYDVDLPTNWQARIISFAEGFTSGNLEWSITTSGSGSTNVQLSTARPIIAFYVYNLTGSDATYTGETGDKYAKWSLLRFINVNQTLTPANDIVSAIVDDVYALNTPPRISDSKSFIPITGRDIPEAVWLDTRADDVIRDLAATIDGTGPPFDQFQARMWGDYLIFGNAPGHRVPWDTDYFENRLTWFADVDARQYERTLSTLANDIYATYRSEANQRTLRTADAVDADSQEQYGIVREDYVRENTTDLSNANANRDKLLENEADPPYRISIDVDRITLEQGGHAVPPWMIWAGDKVIVRDGLRIPAPTATNILVLTIARTDLDLDTMRLKIVPEAGSLSLAMSLAKRPINMGNAQRFQAMPMRAFR